MSNRTFLLLTNTENNKEILVNPVRNDFVKQDEQDRAIFINKSQPPLTVVESFEDVKKMLYSKHNFC